VERYGKAGASCDNVYEPNALGLHRMTAVAMDVDNDLGCGPVVAEPNALVGKYDRQGNCERMFKNSVCVIWATVSGKLDLREEYA